MILTILIHGKLSYSIILEIGKRKKKEIIRYEYFFCYLFSFSIFFLMN